MTMPMDVETADAILRAMRMVEDLNYLRANAFSFFLEFNPHATCHDSVTSWLSDCHDDDWVSMEQQGEALRTQKFIEAQVYPTTSVGFCTVLGTDLADVIRGAAEACREHSGVR